MDEDDIDRLVGFIHGALKKKVPKKDLGQAVRYGLNQYVSPRARLTYDTAIETVREFAAEISKEEES